MDSDAVNVASRLQDMTKTLVCEAIASEEVCVTAGLASGDLPEQQAAIRGRDESTAVRVVADVRGLSARVGDVERSAAWRRPVAPAAAFHSRDLSNDRKRAKTSRY